MILLDTGPLVAFINKGDRLHDWAFEQFNALEGPFYTCQAVWCEAYHLTKNEQAGATGFLKAAENPHIITAFPIQEERARVVSLMRKYADLPMDYADACLVRMAERARDHEVLTIDREFLVYRTEGGDALTVTLP